MTIYFHVLISFIEIGFEETYVAALFSENICIGLSYKNLL
jgi:hypothetical protein